MEISKEKVDLDLALFGLEPRDMLIYRTMLEFDAAASIRTVAAQANQNRGTTFEVIKKLVQNGLVVGQFKNKRKFYSAKPPSALRHLAENRLTQVQSEIEQVDRYVKRLEAVSKFESPSQFTQFYEGDDEIAVLLRDVLDTVEHEESREYLAISSAEIRNHLYGKFRNFTRQRIKRNIATRVIAIGEGGELAELAERRTLSSQQIPDCYVIIYGNKVAQISLSESGNIQGVVVQNKGVMELQRLMFEHLWSIL